MPVSKHSRVKVSGWASDSTSPAKAVAFWFLTSSEMAHAIVRSQNSFRSLSSGNAKDWRMNNS